MAEAKTETKTEAKTKAKAEVKTESKSGFWPEISSISAAAFSTFFLSWVASPTPMLITTLSSRGIAMRFL